MNDDAENSFEDSDEAPGWEAIDEALAPIYGDQEPKHYGTVLPYALGGQDPLTGISVYKNLEPQPHYHFVTYGFSELYEKESEDPDYSGFGFELTFRLACAADAAAEPPTWPLSFLQNLARYVFSSGNAFDERHHMSLNGPIALNEETDITAMMMLLDPQIQEIDTPNGHLKFLQIVGLCTDEHHLIEQGYFDAIAERVEAIAPLAITDIFRDSILKDPKALDEITSSEPTVNQTEVFGTVAQWQEDGGKLQVQVGATVVPQLQAMLKGRVAQGETCVVYGKGSGIIFRTGDGVEWEVEEGLLIVTITPEIATALGDSLQRERGVYSTPDTDLVAIEILPVDIKDADGNVIKTVG
ncbi:suppressor of fused domain protein [Bremerella sp.]|uniref:suppressor of fused domain protein n=1 Tax=Bremerella sp. TaxID=2795602 RepID=UPI00391BCBDE